MSFELISSAFADTPGAAIGGGNNIESLLLLAGFVVIFYFLLWRPQAKRAKEQRNLMSNLATGDEVATSGGLLGKISKLDDNIVTLTIANNVEIKVQKNAVTQVFPKGTLK